MSFHSYDSNYEKITFARNINDEARLYRWRPDRELKLTTVPDTIITCRVCRGSKQVAPKQQNGLITLVPCPNCNMTGIQKSDHIDTLWGRNR